MYDYNNEGEIYNNEINDLNDIKIGKEKYKTNKYNEEEIIMDDNMNIEEQDNIDNQNNLNEEFEEEEYDMNNMNNNNEEFNHLEENNNNINNYDYNNFDNYNNNFENENNNSEYEEDNNLNNQEEEDLIDNNEFNNEFDDMNQLNDINANNNNMNQYNDNNINDIETLKLYIINLEKKCAALEQENKMIKLNKENDPNYGIVENSIKQGTILLDDVKRKNFNLNKKIKILEHQNQELNYKLIEANQKLKRFQNNKNFIYNNNKDINSIIVKLNNKVDENEIMISKLKFDKKILENKLSEDKKYHENELNLMLNYKNSELSVYQKAIDDFKSQNNNNIYLNPNIANNNLDTLKNKLKIKSSKNKALEEKMAVLKKNLTEKDDIIDDLNKKIIELEGNLNLKGIQIQQMSAENETQMSQLINEKNELIKNNEKLSNGLMQFDNKVKEANMIFINKTEFYNKSMNIFKNKIKEYKNKIVTLKNKINELNLVIEKNKIINNENKINNQDIFQRNLLSTPGSFILPKRRMTPFTRKFFDDKNEFIPNNNLNKTNIDIIENNDMNYFNKSQIVQQNEFGYEEDKNQKQYLENYKTFLSGLDTKLKI